jgi:hypothetical protein
MCRRMKGGERKGMKGRENIMSSGMMRYSFFVSPIVGHITVQHLCTCLSSMQSALVTDRVAYVGHCGGHGSLPYEENSP